jgi:dienelactone hydrolase
MKYFIMLVFIMLSYVNSYTDIVKANVDYKDGDTALSGFLAYDGAISGKRPGILLVHEWWGLNDYIMKRAEQVAALGYVAFAADIYGKGVRAKTAEEAARLSRFYSNNRKLMLSRAMAALSVLKSNPLVDQTRVAAMGYCFGGGVVLELGRSGEDLAGIVSFHGNLSTPNTESNGNIKGKVLVLHGADDPFVNAAAVDDFENSMRKTHVDWQVVLYGGAVHGFTNPANGNDPSKGLSYNEIADKRSWKAMQDFYEELFNR